MPTVVDLKNITLVKNKKVILKDICWRINKGEHWAVLGQNGSGKTMLLNIVTAAMWPTAGDVTLLGKKLGEVDLRSLRSLVSLVTSRLEFDINQNDQVLNIVLSGYFATVGLFNKPSPKLIITAQKLLEFFDIALLQNEIFAHLSQGQKKRVLLARSLINNPKLLLLDESQDGLDMKAKKVFLAYLNKLTQDKTGPVVVMVTHHIEEIIPGITHLLLLKKGKIYAQGAKAEILNTENIKNLLDL